jgi:AcrR family transcriptional regulator
MVEDSMEAPAAAGSGPSAHGDPPRRRPGRPRSPQADTSILNAALELLVEVGYRAMTMEEVRARAGVGKATIYRRWKSKAELVKDVVARLHDADNPPDTGSLRDDWTAFAGAALASSDGAARVLVQPRLMVEAVGDRELSDIFYENLVAPRRAALGALVRRGIDRGEVRADVDVEVAVDLLAGPLWYRLLLAGGDVDRLGRTPGEIYDAVIRGLGERGERRP